jgi:transcriptional regulator with XRE-family HTH domain
METAELKSGTKTRPAEKGKGFDAEAFYEALARVVEARKMRWRQVGKETGVTPSTLTRMGQGRRPDAASLAALSAWAGLNPADFVATPRKYPPRSDDAVNANPLVAIAGLLRADTHLQPAAAKALADIIHIAYDKFKRGAPPPA